jgi:hypothetical protein
MDDSELVKESFRLLELGLIEAAEARFREYLAQRVKVGSDNLVQITWARCVAEKRRELDARQPAAAQQAKGKNWWRAQMKSLN